MRCNVFVCTNLFALKSGKAKRGRSSNTWGVEWKMTLAIILGRAGADDGGKGREEAENWLAMRV